MLLDRMMRRGWIDRGGEQAHMGGKCGSKKHEKDCWTCMDKGTERENERREVKIDKDRCIGIQIVG